MIEFYIYLGIVTLAIILIGVWGYRVGKKTAFDYIIAGGTIGWLAGYFWIAFVIYSAWTFFGYAGYLYLVGPAYHYYPMMAHMGFAFAVWFLGRKFLSYRSIYGALTPADVLRLRYDSKMVGLISAIIWTIFIVPYIGLQITAIGATLTTFIGLPYEFGVIYMAIVMLLLILLGGMRGVAWANVLWGTIMIVAFIAPLIWAITLIPGGLAGASSVISQKGPELLLFGKVSPAFGLGLAFAGLTVFCWPHVLIATLGMREKKTLFRVTILWLLVGGFIVYLGAFLWGNLVAPILAPGLTGKAADTAVLVSIKNFAPLSVVMFVILAVLAAAISTANTQLMTASALASNNMIKQFKTLSDVQLIWATRIITFVILIFGTLFAYTYPIEIARMLDYVASPGYSLLTAALLGLYWKRGTKEGVIASLLVGLVYLVVATYVYTPLLMGTHPAVVPVILAAVVYVIVSLITKPSEKALEAFEKTKQV
ncbi:MAG: sodium:solute symporter family protein [Candidatus Bathyarchaeota archaeon]